MRRKLLLIVSLSILIALHGYAQSGHAGFLIAVEGPSKTDQFVQEIKSCLVQNQIVFREVLTNDFIDPYKWQIWHSSTTRDLLGDLRRGFKPQSAGSSFIFYFSVTKCPGNSFNAAQREVKVIVYDLDNLNEFCVSDVFIFLNELKHFIPSVAKSLADLTTRHKRENLNVVFYDALGSGCDNYRTTLCMLLRSPVLYDRFYINVTQNVENGELVIAAIRRPSNSSRVRFVCKRNSTLTGIEFAVDCDMPVINLEDHVNGYCKQIIDEK